MRLGTVLCFSLVLGSIQASSKTTRLQRNITPNSYSLTLIPNIQNGTYTGEVTILVKLQQSLSNITLNSRKLTIKEVTLDQSFGRTGFKHDEANELLHIFYEDYKVIDPGEHILNIKFHGSLVDDMFGFYMLNYTTSGVSGTILATKFSAMNARAAFPCFDEPYFKSIFSIRLVKPNDEWTALSNMKEIRSFNTSHGIAVDFQSTIPMSTYLLAWILTDFTHEKIYYNPLNKTLPLRFFTHYKKAKFRREALNITKKTLQFFEDYTGIPFPLSKLDSIEVPSYRSRGMEHWGLIVYSGNSITFDPTTLGSELIHYIDTTELITHEISHMWFGNLVTHDWYNSLWLTEGFARFMQYKVTHALLKEPFLKRMFQKQTYRYLFQMQCSDSWARETASYSKSIHDVWYLYGPTTYDQGAAILLMVENIIGAEKFQQIIRSYLRKYQYSHATTGDLLNLFDKAVPDARIRNLMETYLFQKKLPLIRITEDEHSYILEQEPLCNYGDKSFFNDKWTIPVNYITSSTTATPRVIWFDKDMKNVVIPKSKGDRWIKTNFENWGLYHTLYTNNIYDAIRQDFKKLPLDDRGAFVEEIFLLEAYGNVSCDIPLQFLLELRNITDIDFITFTYASRSFSIFLRTTNFGNEVDVILKSYFIHLFGSLYNKVGWTVEEDESLDHRLLRIAVLESFCFYKHKYAECYKAAENIRQNNVTLHEDIDYIYKKVISDRQRANFTVENYLNMTTSTPQPLISAEEEKCANWIKQNLPKFMKAAVVPPRVGK